MSRSFDPVVKDGVAYALFAYDVGHGVDLNEAEKHLKAMTARAPIRHQRRAPQFFNFQPTPLRVTQGSAAHKIGAFQTSPAVETVIYDFGAVCVSYQIPLSGPFSGLLALSEALYDNEALLADSRRLVEELLKGIGPAVHKPEISSFYEDYVIYQFKEFDSAEAPERLVRDSALQLAQLLRADTDLRSEQEIEDALLGRISYGADDVTIVDWVSSVIFAKAAEDTRAVIEFGQAQLLELRHLDNQLDMALERTYQALTRQTSRKLSFFPSGSHELEEIGQLQVESAVLFEGINNALKLLGDQYLARLYEQLAKRHHLASWDESILRKLRTLESIYSKIEDAQSTTRMEFLEWIIIVLIAVSLVMPFLGKH